MSIRNSIRDFLIFLASFVPQITRMGTDSVFHDPRLSAKSAVYIHLRLCRARFICGDLKCLLGFLDKPLELAPHRHFLNVRHAVN